MKKIRHCLRGLLLVFPLLFASLLMADDTEIYYAQTTSANPNILFVLDTSLSMECQADPDTGLYDKPNTSCINKNLVPDSGGKTRMQVMQEAFSTVMASAPNNLNVGLMRYGGHSEDHANGVSFPIKPIDLDKDGNGDARSVLLSGIADLTQDNLPDPVAGKPVRQFLSEVVNGWTAGGNTPIVDALAEASRYYRGQAVDFGNLAASHIRAAHPSSYANDGTLNCQTYENWCNKTVGECGTQPVTDCKLEKHTVCEKYEPETITTTTPNQCCAWGKVKQAGVCQECTTVQKPSICEEECITVKKEDTCQECKTIGYDESGNAITSCKNVACLKDVKECKQVACLKDVKECKDVACMKDVDQCTGGFTCSTTNTTTKNKCVQESVTEVEYCKQTSSQCSGAKRYISPMEYECQANYIVLMSDGRPEYAGSAGNGGGINKYPQRKFDLQTLTGTGNNCGNDAPNGYKSGTCGPELTRFLATKDQSPALADKQTIGTFTVAFGVDDSQGQAYLASLANMPAASFAANDAASLQLAFEQVIRRVNQVGAGQVLALENAAYQAADFTVAKPRVLENPSTLGLLGEDMAFVRTALLELLNPVQYWQQLRNLAAVNSGAFTASNLNDLTNSFNEILNKIDAAASSFSSPSYSVDKSNLLAHGDNIYIPVFDRSQLPLWSGNLKKFKIANQAIDADNDGVVDIKKGQIYSTKNHKPAVDSKGQFTDDAWDLWSGSANADGKPVTAGGAAAQLNPVDRKLYTDAGGVIGTLTSANTQISKTLLGDAGMGDGLRDSLLAFARGYDKDGTTVRHHMGDIMNSKPVVIDYNDGKSYVIVGTNEGYLHVFDSTTGTEQWAFMPQTLLKNIPIFFDNNQAKTHVYGIDGQLTPWLYDKNGDGKIDKDNGERAYLFFGMRRGGRAYYALDITDMSQPPTVKWSISNNHGDFAELGETWSKPALAKMRVQPNPSLPAELKDVLVFGGGFDPALEEADPSKRSPDSMGRDVFIIDAESGAKLWSLRADVSGASTRLKHSIPGDIRVMDMDRNGALDRLYFADTGGHLWRVDMDMDIRDADSSMYAYQDAQLTLFADLADSGVDARKFYYEPDVALMQDKGQTILTIAIGSGYRSRPLNSAIDDRFYVLKDSNVYQPAPATFTALTDADLMEADALANAGKTLLDAGQVGWYYDLPHTGEKVLAPAISFLNKVVFTTFANDGEATDPCNAPPNSARAYVLDLFNGQAVADLDRDGSLDPAKDKFVVAGINEILGGAQVIFNAPAAANGVDACSATDCQQTVDIRVGKMLLPVMDSNNALGNGVAGSVDLTDILPRVFWRDAAVSNY